MASPKGMAVAGIVLVFAACGILIYTWYVYVFRICVGILLHQAPAHTAQAIVFIIIATLLWLMALLSYVRIVTTRPGSPKKMSGDLLAETEQGTVNGQRTPFQYSPTLFNQQTMTQQKLPSGPTEPLLSISRQDGLPRFCDRCQCFKPDRAHHCKDCDVCVLKMDHHCPWINGCVGQRNYKFFFLFVLYTGLYSLWCLCSSLPLVINALKDTTAEVDPQWIVLLIFAFIFGVTVSGFACVHFYYILTNKSTIECLADRAVEVRVDFDTSGQNFETVNVPYSEPLWSIGWYANLQTVLGSNPSGWLVPLFGGVGDGFVYPYNKAMYSKIVSQANQKREALNVPPAEASQHDYGATVKGGTRIMRDNP